MTPMVVLGASCLMPNLPKVFPALKIIFWTIFVALVVNGSEYSTNYQEIIEKENTM